MVDDRPLGCVFGSRRERRQRGCWVRGSSSSAYSERASEQERQIFVASK